MNDYNINLIKIDHNPVSSHPPYSQPYVLCVNVEHGATVLTYHVYIGPFMLIMKVLNIDEDINNSFDVTTLGKGCFGSIIAQNEGNKQFVAKRIKFQRKPQLSTPVNKID
jgi:hypothetical protein